ncbi:MAG: proprotein convertase P-domain-containing protein, partial [Planctomycetales bacterium]|nr:proprotein convertase P-domain-containing protein [Planctomycetales bacterium]
MRLPHPSHRRYSSADKSRSLYQRTPSAIELLEDRHLLFAPYTHVEIGNDVVEDALLDNQVTIDGSTYDVNPDLLNVFSNPANTPFFNAGLAGSSAFPDISFGRDVIRSGNSGEWLTHLYNKAWEAQDSTEYSTPEKEQILAWSYGYLSSAIGDIWSSAVVNEIAGGPFPQLGELDGDVANQEIALRHFFVENYIADATPSFDGNPGRATVPTTGDVSDDSTPAVPMDAPHSFIYETFLESNAGQPDAGRGEFVQHFLDLRARLEELAADPVLGSDTNVVGEVANVNSVEDAIDDVNSDCATSIGLPINVTSTACQTALQALGIEGYEYITSDVLDLADEQAESLKRELLRTYIRRWIADIDEGIVAWSELSLAVTQAVYDPETRRDIQNDKCIGLGAETGAARVNCENGVGVVEVIKKKSDDYVNQHLLRMLGSPHFVGGLNSALTQFVDIIGKAIRGSTDLHPLLNGLASLKSNAESMITNAVNRVVGFDLDAFGDFLKSPSAKLGVDEVTIDGTTLQIFAAGDRATLDGYLGLTAGDHLPLGAIDTFGSLTFHDGIGRLTDTAEFNKSTFAAYANSVTMTKMLFLDDVALNTLLQGLSGVAAYDASLLHTNTKYAPNILSLTLPHIKDDDGNEIDSTHWVASINDGSAWRADAQPTAGDIGGGNGNFPLWESCLLRDSFSNVFTDWQNGALQFPDLGDETSHDPNENAPDVWYFDSPSFFGGTQTLYVNGIAAHSIQVEDDGVNIEVSWPAIPGLHCAGSESLPVGDVGQIIVNGISSVTTIGTTVTTTSNSGLIIGEKYNDANGDGVHAATGEPGLQHWKITLDTDVNGDTLEPTRFTSPSGTYLFPGLPFGTYDVHEEVVAGWKQSAPVQNTGDEHHTVTLNAGNPAETNVDFGNYRTVDVDWLPALGAFLDETLQIKQNPLEVIGFDRSFDDFVNLPFVERNIHEIVDFEGLFRQIDLSLYEDAKVVANNDPAAFNATNAKFLVSAGGATPIEFTTTVAGNSNLNDLVASLNTALTGTDLDGVVEFAAEGTALALQTAAPGLMPALTVATLRLIADNNGPNFGQLDPMDGPIDPFTVKVVRTIPDAAGVPTAQPEEEYEFKIGAEPPTGTELFVHTQDNTSLTDLANDLNDGFTSVGLFDIIAVVEGSKLVLAATSPTVTEITIDGMTGDRLGFSNNQNVDTGSNANAAQTVLGFEGGQGLADRMYDSIHEMLPLVEAAVITVSNDAGLPINGGGAYSINAEYDVENETVEFNLKLNHNFTETVYTNDFENSIDLFGNLTNPMPATVLGPLEIGANLQADFSIPARLDLDVGIKLGERSTGFKISKTSKLSWLHGQNGVDLNVGLVAPNVIPAGGVPGQDVDFTLEYRRENGTYSFDFTLTSSPTAEVTSYDNTDGESLASDLNNLLRDEFLGDSFRFEVQTTTLLNASGNEIGTEERLMFRAVDSGIRGFSLIGGDIDELGFAAGQQDSDFDDLTFTIGTPGGDTDCSDNNCSFSISLNGALTVQDVIDRIEAYPGVGSEPAVRVSINDAQDGLTLEANDQLIVTAASTPTKLTQGVSGTDVDEQITSLAALSLGILGISNDDNVLVGSSLDGATVRDRIYIIERDATDPDKNVQLGVGVDFPTIDASVGFSQISLELDGDAQFDVSLATNLRDPGRKFFSGAGGDGKVTLSERFTFPGEVYYLNPFDPGTLQINMFASANLGLGLGFDTGGNDFLELITGPLGSLIELTAVADTANNQFVFDVESQFLEVLQNLNNITVEDIVNLIRVFAESLKSDDDLAEGNTEVTFVSGGISATEQVGNGIEDAADSVDTALDLPTVRSAIDDVEEAIDNLDMPAEQRVQMQSAISTLRAAAGNDNIADANGKSRVPARLIAASRKLSKAIDAEVETLVTPPAGKSELIDAKDNLFSLVPALNAIEQIISDAIEQKLEELLDFNPADFDFDLGIANDINTSGDDALLVGLSVHGDNLLSKTFVPEMPLSAEFGPLEFEVEPTPVQLYVGGAVGVGLAFNFQDKQPLVIVEPPTALGNPPVFDGIPVHKTELDLNVGFVTHIDADASFGNLDLVGVEADLTLLRSTIDKFDPVDFSDYEVELSTMPFEGTDGRYIIVAVSETLGDGSISSDVLTAETDYTVTENAGTYTVEIDPGYVFGAADRVTVEYHTTDPTTIDPSVVGNRVAFKLDFEPKIAITDNDIGAVPLFDLFSDTHTRIDAQGDDVSGNPTFGSLLIGSVDASLLNSNANDVIAVATSMQHVLQPQLYFDDEAIGQLLEGVDFDLKTILLGIEAFLETLEDGLKGDILDKLPVINADDLDMAATFIGKLRTEFLEPFLDVLCNAGGDLAAVELVIEQFILDKLGPTGIGILVDRTGPPTVGLEDVEVTITQDNFDVAFSIGGSDKMVVDFDTGLEGLKIDASGSGGVELGWDYSIDFGVGVDRDGFYFSVNDEVDEANPVDPEIELNIGAALIVDTSGPEPIPTSIGVNLFGLELTATDNNDGPNPGTFIAGMLTLDINDVGANDNKLEISDFANTSFGEIFDASLSIPVQLDIHLEAGINSNIPSIEADLKLDWGVEIAHTAGSGGIDVVTQDLNFAIEDLGINLGDFLSKHIGRVLDAIDNYIEPLKPIIKVFKTEIPGLSEASELAGKGPVTFLDVAFIKEPEKGKQAKKFVDALDTILSLIDSLKTVDESDKVSFILLDELKIIDSAMTGGTDGGLTDPNFNQMTDAGEKAEMATPNDRSGLKSKVKNLLQKVEDLGINLHILEPKTLVNILLGRPFDIVSYELPRFELPFSWEISFRVFPVPPIALRIGIDFDIFADLSVGYDSRGIDTGNFFDGFYFGDLQDVIAGPDIEEFGLGLGARLAALLDIGFASAGVEGEIRADVLANWRDSDDNGKLHLDEIVDIVKADGFSCLFDLRGELRAIVRLVWEVFGVDGDYELINKVLLEFENECPKYELGHVVAGTTGTITPGPSAVSAPGTLVIHAGPFASERRSGSTSDVAEDVIVTQTAPGVMKVEMLGLMKSYSGVKHIYFDGGKQNDSITLIGVDVPITAIGGSGDDSIEGTRYADYLDGGAGNDIIRGRGDGDTILGGSGNDTVYADLGPGESSGTWGSDGNDHVEAGSGNDFVIAAGGADYVDGGSGDDEIYGHIDAAASVSADADAADELHGGIGNDVIFGNAGNDLLFGDGGRDEIYGEDGDDTMDGGPGKDLLLGDVGDDTIEGGSGPDIISGGIGSDVLRGDDGADFIIGGLLTGNTEQTTLFESLWGADASFVAMIQAMETAGTDSNDQLTGGRDSDLLVGDAGGDQLLGGYGDDAIIANLILDPTSTDMEYIEGGPDNDFICGAHGQDEIYGGTSLIGLADVLADAVGPTLGGGFTMTSCDSLPEIIPTPDPATITGVKFNDQNEDGLYDASEPGLEGWTINLLDTDGDIVDSQITNSDGEYTFSDVDPGSYRVVEEAQDYWTQTTPGGIDLRDMAIDPTTGNAFAISANSLYSIDLLTNVATFIVSLGVGPQSAMTFSTDGTLYTMGFGDPNLYAINTTTGAATTIANTGHISDGGLTFNPADNHVYLSNGSTLVKVDPGSGTTTVVGAHGVNGMIALRANSFGQIYGLDINLNFYGINRTSGQAVSAGGDTFETLGLVSLPIDAVSIVDNSLDDGYEFSILTGQTAADINFGNRFQGGEIRGRKYNDINADGIRQLGEPYLNGWNIEVYDEFGSLAGIATTADLDLDDNGIIDDDTEKGWYVVGDLTPGNFTITELAVPDWVQTEPHLSAANAFQPIADDGYEQTRSDLFVGGMSGVLTNATLTLNIQHKNVQELKAFLLSPDGTRIDLFDSVGADGDNFTSTTFSDTATTNIEDGTAPFTGSFKPVDLLSLLIAEDPNGLWTLVVEDTIEGTAGRLDSWTLTLTSTGSPTTTFSGGDSNPHNSSRLHHLDVTVGPDEIVDDVNFGNYRIASINGFKFSDTNGNSLRDSNEPGLAGVTIYADLNNNGELDRGEPSTQTRTDSPSTTESELGTFTLSPLAPGNYAIREVVPDNHMQTFPVTTVAGVSGTHNVTLVSGQSLGGPNDRVVFGNQPKGSIHGTKWLDQDRDGVRDPNEPGVPGVTIFVDLNGNGEFDMDEPSAVTMADDPATDFDEAGMYWLENLSMGTYEIHEVVPNGMIQTSGGSATIYENDFESMPAFGMEWTSPLVSRAAGIETNFLGPYANDSVSLHLNGLPAHNTLNVEFDLFVIGDWDGYGSPATGTPDRWLMNVLGEAAVIDTTFSNAESTLQAYPGTFTLDFHDPQTGAFSVDALEYIDASGQVLFGSVYHLTATISHSANTLQLQFRGDDLADLPGEIPELWGIDNLSITAPVAYHEVTLDHPGDVKGYDFGNAKAGSSSIHGQKWNDINGDGKRQEREFGIDGWVIKLYDDNGNVVATNGTMSMDLDGDGQIDPFTESGLYWFDQLPPGRYTVSEMQRAGWKQTYPATVPEFMPGDSNFDYEFNSSDFIVVFQAAKYEKSLPATFAEGDWNGDGLFNSSDFVLVFTIGHYEQGPYAKPNQHNYVVELRDDQVIVDRDFGNHNLPTEGKAAEVRGQKWNDLNGDGWRDTNEGPLAGVTIYVDANFNGQLDPGEASTVTAEDGHYSLVVPPGDIVVREIVPAGFTQTYPIARSHSLHLVGGQIMTGVLFGNVREDQIPPVPVARFAGEVDNRSAIHGTKWQDLDGDGVFDSNEPTLSGVTIYLDLNKNGLLDQITDAAGNITDEPSTVTGPTGQYSFVSLSSGEYIVREIVPSGFKQTFPGGDRFAHIVALDAGQAVDGRDFGNRPTTGSIHGRKWLDIDGSGKRDPNEPGLGGVTIYVDINQNGVLDPNEPSTVTMFDDPATQQNEAGMFWLENVPVGTTIQVREVVPTGMIQTFPANPDYHLVRFGEKPIIEGLLFGNRRDDRPPTGSIHGTKWLDERLNGKWEPEFEPGVAGVTIYLDLNGNGQLDPNEPSTVTMEDDPNTPQNEQGMYWLDGIPPGTYIVTEVVPFGFDQIFPADGQPHTVTIDGQTVEGVNFGNYPKRGGEIHGIKWLDNQDPLGEHNDGEPGLAGVTIYLDLNGNGQLDNNEPSTVTMSDDPLTPEDETGQYWFSDVPAGNYQVREVVPAGYVQSFPFNQLSVAPLPLVGLTTSPFDGRLYSITQSGDIHRFLPNSAVSSVIGNLAFAIGEGDVEFDPTNGVLYAIDSGATSSLHRIDLGTDPMTGDPYVVSMSTVGVIAGVVDPSAMAIDITGNLIVVDLDPAGPAVLELNKYDASVISTTALTGLPTPIPTIAGLTYDPSLGEFLFATASAVYTLDLSGSVASLTPINVPNLAGIANSDNRYHDVTVSAGDVVEGIDFGNFEPIYLPDGDDIVFAQDATDTIYGDNFVNDPRIISTGSRSDTLFGDGGADLIFGQEESDQLSGGSDSGTPADDLLDGGLGIDRVYQAVDNDQTLTNTQLFGEGTDQLVSIERGTLIGGAGNNVLDASAFLFGPVELSGLGGDDELIGTTFADLLDGGMDSDMLRGGDGDDTYQFGDVNILVPTETDTIEEASATGGIDTLDFSMAPHGVGVALNSTTVATHPVSLPQRVVVVAAAGQEQNLENVVGSAFNDLIEGNAADNVILAGLGNDIVVNAGAGNDTINLGGGTGESANGGLDDDTYVFNAGWGDATVSEVAGSGNDTLHLASVFDDLTFEIHGSPSVTDGVNVVSFSSQIENLNSGNGDDLFEFADGFMLPSGGSINSIGGTDLLDFANYSSSINVDLNSGTATAAGSTIGVSGIEDVLGGSAADTITGDAFANFIRGGAGGDTLVGLGGSDTIFGNEGNDTIDGGTGNDLLHGNEDDDSITGGDDDDTIVYVDGDGFDAVTETAAGGNDVLDLSAVTSALTVDIGAIINIDLTSGGDLIDASTQIESLLLGSADDVVQFANGASISGSVVGGLGINELDYSAYLSGVVVDLSLSTATGTTSVTGFTNVTGGAAGDLLIGDDGDNRLDGQAGDDTIHGGKGADELIGGPATVEDHLFGGPGDDTYRIQNNATRDVLHEQSGTVSGGLLSNGGIDTVDLRGVLGATTFSLNLSSVQTVAFGGPDVQLDGAANFENATGSLFGA